MDLDPLLILAVGITTILGLILVLRVNAFLALIISAILVSLLAPGTVDIKIQRVADAFGKSAGSIAIVIGLAAIIGECMMLSGAADRIVQAFLSLLGQKRASWALMGSGYVLAVPVFFDTVFYLLVPLARSLYRRTGRNYLLYILAIAAGGAITHTLVPPTPGPLVMASTLGIDVGVMILVGGLVALPAAVVGLAVSSVLDRRLNIPFRDDRVVGTEDDQPAVPESYPPLMLALLPVLLPVLLISTNTALTTAANNERAARLAPADIVSWDFLTTASDASTPAGRLRSFLSAESQVILDRGGPTNKEVDALVADLNFVLGRKNPPLFDNAVFDTAVPKRWKIEAELKRDPGPEETARLKRQLAMDDLLKTPFGSLQLHERERFNRTLLEVSFPEAVRPHEWNSPLRKAADVSSLFGNANLALLLSTIVAMFLLYRQKHPTLAELSQTVETSLMSGGTIILITAAGGAFGAMLKEAQIGPAIESRFAGGTGPGSGLAFLLLGYGVATLLKIAQGSSTVAMITVSGMLAAMVANVNLGFHPVYLATAIGAGSLMGSWMNDSGFWIFTKMGRLTETESLKSWTVMLAVLSLTSLTITCLLAMLMPLT